QIHRCRGPAGLGLPPGRGVPRERGRRSHPRRRLPEVGHARPTCRRRVADVRTFRGPGRLPDTGAQAALRARGSDAGPRPPFVPHRRGLRLGSDGGFRAQPVRFPQCRLRGRAMNRTLLVLSLLLASAPAGAVQTIVSLTFDDGSADQMAAVTMLNDRGMKGTFYINTGRIGESSFYMTQADLQAIAGAGHEIAGHSVHHYDLATLPPDEVQHEICDDRRQLIAWGYNPV